jgi:hypothetical protein
MVAPLAVSGDELTQMILDDSILRRPRMGADFYRLDVLCGK